jgi:hypothetical protein
MLSTRQLQAFLECTFLSEAKVTRLLVQKPRANRVEVSFPCLLEAGSTGVKMLLQHTPQRVTAREGGTGPIRTAALH